MISDQDFLLMIQHPDAIVNNGHKHAPLYANLFSWNALVLLGKYCLRHLKQNKKTYSTSALLLGSKIPQTK